MELTLQGHKADAVRAFHEALAAERAGNLDMAYQILIGAVDCDPSLQGAWNNIGSLLSRQKRFLPAAAAYYRCLELAPNAPMISAAYAWMMHLSGRAQEALPFIRKAVELEPEKFNHRVNYSQTLLASGRKEEALRQAEEAVRLAPSESQAYLALALAQLRFGDYAAGLKNYESRLAYVPELRAMLNYPYPLWRGEDISEKRLFIPCEQGLGDSVMFLRFIPGAIRRAKHTVIHVHDTCYKLFDHNLKITCQGDHKYSLYVIPKELPADTDVYCPLLSIPVAMGLSNGEIKNSYWEYKVPSAPIKLDKTKRNIGIAWAGDARHDNDLSRSSTLPALMLLAELPNTQLYSIQLGDRRKDLEYIGAHGVVKDIGGYLRDASDTCAFAKHQFDAVVSVDTAPAHMAASVGCKTFIILSPAALDWRWQDGKGETHWYPSAELVMQEHQGDWKTAIDQVKTKLA